MFVFLYPNSLNTKCECDKFIKITYQDLVDKVIEPCLLRTHSDISKFYISEYLKTLSYSSEDLKGQLVMAISKEEKELCEEFFAENRELLTYVTKVLSLSNYDDDDFERLSDIIADTVNKNSSSRDLTKYSFNDDGNKYGKGRLALKIFRETSKQCNTLDELKEIFQEVFKLHSVKEINIINNNLSNSTWAPEYYERRFFTNYTFREEGAWHTTEGHRGKHQGWPEGEEEGESMAQKFHGVFLRAEGKQRRAGETS